MVTVAAAAARQVARFYPHKLRRRRGPTWGRSRTDSGAAPRRLRHELCATRVYVSATPRATLRLFGARREARSTSRRRAQTDAPSPRAPSGLAPALATYNIHQPPMSRYIIGLNIHRSLISRVERNLTWSLITPTFITFCVCYFIRLSSCVPIGTNDTTLIGWLMHFYRLVLTNGYH